MIIQARFGSAQTGLGYQFYSAAGTLLGSRITAGIVSLPETGSYAANATVPADSVGVFWDSSTSEATEDLREALAPTSDNTEVLAAIGELPTEAEIIAAAGGISSETAEKLDAAAQVVLVTLYEPTENPSVIIPAPASDPNDCVLYLDTQDFDNAIVPGVKIIVTPIGVGPYKNAAGYVIGLQEKTMVTGPDGRATMTVERVDLLTPLTLTYKVNCPRYKIDKRIITPNSDTLNLNTLIP